MPCLYSFIEKCNFFYDVFKLSTFSKFCHKLKEGRREHKLKLAVKEF